LSGADVKIAAPDCKGWPRPADRDGGMAPDLCRFMSMSATRIKARRELPGGYDRRFRAGEFSLAFTTQARI
jgi:hypothetical protein